MLKGKGALVTGSTLLIIIISKFTEGAWIVIVVIPPLMLLFIGIRRYHERLRGEIKKDTPLKLDVLCPPVVAIPIKRLDPQLHAKTNGGMLAETRQDKQTLR